MNFIFSVLIFCLFVFLYIIYFLSHDDFVILRTNTPMEKIFNAVFLSSLFSLFSARFFYVFFNPKSIFFNPLGFLVFPYFPGLSLTGAILGGYFISLFILKSWNMPVGRLVDFFSMGFLVSFPLGFIGDFLLSSNKGLQPVYLSLILYSLLLFIFVKFILPMSSGGKLKDGSLSLLFMFSFSFVYLLSNILFDFGKIVLTPENIISILNVLVFFAVFTRRENLIDRFIYKKQ